MSNIKTEIEEIIRDISGYEQEIDPTIDLVEKRIVKSVMLLEIIATIEEDYNMEITSQHIYDGHFLSVNSICKFIEQNS